MPKYQSQCSHSVSLQFFISEGTFLRLTPNASRYFSAPKASCSAKVATAASTSSAKRCACRRHRKRPFHQHVYQVHLSLMMVCDVFIQNGTQLAARQQFDAGLKWPALLMTGRKSCCCSGQGDLQGCSTMHNRLYDLCFAFLAKIMLWGNAHLGAFSITCIFFRI
jgi:hypothetical protein